MAKKKIIRRWLNKKGHQSVAFILAEVNTETWNQNLKSGKTGDTKTRSNVNAILTIGDCSRVIALDLSVYDGNKGDIANAKYKLDTLIGTLEEFRVALEEHINESSTTGT